MGRNECFECNEDIQMTYGWGWALKTIKLGVPGLGAVFKVGDLCIMEGSALSANCLYRLNKDSGSPC